AFAGRVRIGRRARIRSRRGVSVLLVVCGGFIALVLFCAITGALLAPHSPSAENLLVGTSGPSPAHLLGTDDSGRDILSRVVAGARLAVIGPVVIALGAALIGTLLGVN